MYSNPRHNRARSGSLRISAGHRHMRTAHPTARFSVVYFYAVNAICLWVRVCFFFFFLSVFAFDFPSFSLLTPSSSLPCPLTPTFLTVYTAPYSLLRPKQWAVRGERGRRSTGPIAMCLLNRGAAQSGSTRRSIQCPRYGVERRRVYTDPGDSRDTQASA
ncbi:hypothetical protein C8F04DRAFT_243043 [Mycena alexandri]|uniref:Transmembrane protein n=1 Tax=Mycena alexandri TaxID=1745969 RepID=A0AAD6S6Y5_9AGAR|nr:hypothetical protein C8F04DRAFT_243043 [Mycena alexandri]